MKAKTERLQFTVSSLLRALAIVVGALIIISSLGSARRMLMWILTAGTLAGLVYPITVVLARRMPKILAVLISMIVLWGTVGYAAYNTLDELTKQTKRLQKDAPARVAKLSKEDTPLGRALKKADAEGRTSLFFKQLPDRLRGGPPAKAIRGAATRGVAILVINVLTIFFLLHMQEFISGLLTMISDQKKRRFYKVRLENTFRRSFGYLRGSLVMAVVAGTFAYVIARMSGVPAPFPLAINAAVWDIVPIVGAFVGGIPIAILALTSSTTTSLIILGVFAVYQACEEVFVQPRVERKTVRPGPFITVVAMFAGLEAFGVGGQFLALIVAVGVVTWFDEVIPDTGKN